MDMSAILSELDDHGFADTSSTRKVGCVNDTCWDICSREPWPFLEASTDTFSLVAGQREPVLPTNFRASLSLVVPSLARVLVPERADTIMKNYASMLAANGSPNYYYFVGEKMRLYPVPDANYTATLTYLQHQAELNVSSLETDFLLPPRHHRAIVLGALSKLYSMEDDPEIAAVFESQYEKRIQVIENDLWKKQYDRTDRIVDVWDDS